jgi:hypothetical protein
MLKDVSFSLRSLERGDENFVLPISELLFYRILKTGMPQLSVGPPLRRTYAAPAVCWGGGDATPPLPCLDLGR